MRCPKCYSDNVQLHIEKDKQGYSLGKGCCGFILLGGPLGLLCGLCGKNNVVSEDEYWICNSCGKKFTDENTGDAAFEYRQKIKDFEKDGLSNPNHKEYEEKKEYAREKIFQSLSQEARDKFIFFDSENTDERIFGIIKTYAPVCDVDLSNEFIYFIYSEGNFLGEDGIIVSSKGIHHRSLPTYKLTTSSSIEKVSLDEGKVLINDKTKLSFDGLEKETDQQVVVEILNKLFIKEKEYVETKSNVTGYANHIANGGVVEIFGKIYYVRKTPNNVALVENENGNETIIYYNAISCLCSDGKNLFFINDVGAICKVDVFTKEISYLCNDICKGLYLYRNKLFFINASQKSKIYSMSTDGSNCALLVSDKAYCITVINEWIYYINQSDKNSIYKASVDGVMREKLCGEIKCDTMATDGEYIYFTSTSFKDFQALYRTDMNGNYMQALNVHASNINITDSRIYYLYDNVLYVLEKRDLNTRYTFLDYSAVSNVHIVNGRVYYCEHKYGLHSHVTHRVDCEGGAAEKL